MKNIIKKNIAIIMFFFFVFIIGIFTFKDYGITGDEVIERNHTLVNNYYYMSILTGDFNGYTGKVLNKNMNLEKIMDAETVERRPFFYVYKYYGVAIQMPFVMIEDLFNYKLEYSTVYYIRHLGTFLIFFVSLIYFYKLLNKFVLNNKFYSLLGTLFLVISPRIYGDAFYNIKDLIFMSLVIINIYYCLIYLNSDKKIDLIKLSIITAFTINCRIIGGIIIFICILFKIFSKKKKKNVLSLFILFLLTYIIYILITPMSLENPILFPFKTIECFFNYNDPISHIIFKCKYFGKMISSLNLPWHYLLIWIIITTPFIYIILFVIGIIKKFKNNNSILFINIVLLLTLSSFAITRPVLYDGWRHFYFIYPLIITNSILGLKYLVEKYNNYKKIIFIILFINIGFVSTWMIRNHPYEMEYFSLPFRKYTMKNFEVDNWKIVNNEAIKYIINNDTNRNITVFSENTAIIHLLNKNDKKRIRLVNIKENPDYIIDNSINKKNISKYIEIKNKKIDNVRFYTIYKRK